MNPLNSVRGAITTGFVARIAASRSLIPPTTLPRTGARALAAHPRGRHVDRPALLLQRGADPGPGRRGRRQGRPGRRRHHKYIAPRALFWFRWAAVGTWLTGAWYLARSGNLGGAFTLGVGSDPFNYYQLVIGIGAWLGTIMLFNVWGADLAEPEEDPRPRARRRTRKRPRRARSRRWPRARTSCCRSRCCSAWPAPRTACRSERETHRSQRQEPGRAGFLLWDTHVRRTATCQRV